MIGRFFRWLFGGCEHDWKLETEGNIKNNGKVVGKVYIQKCPKCQRMRDFEYWP